jgi:endoplasmic reticulum-Golgi intermediate compartment protein 3
MFRSMFNRLKHFDAYPKPLEDFRVKTLSGAVITVICTVVIIILFTYEWLAYVTIEVDQELFVDLTRNQKLTINLNMTLPHFPCQLLSVDAMDVSGEHQSDVVKGLKKIRLDKEGKIIEEAAAPHSSIPSTTSSTDKPSTANTVLDPANDNKTKCLSCYGAEASNFKCCNTCNDVRNAYRQKNWHFRYKT